MHKTEGTVCFFVHTPFQLMFATIIEKKIKRASKVMVEYDGRNKLESHRSFVEENWAVHSVINTERKKDPSEWLTIKNSALKCLEDCAIFCLWSIHSRINQEIMKDAKKKGITVYVFPEGLIAYDYFQKGLVNFVKRITGRYRYDFDHFFTYFGAKALNHPQVRRMPFLFNREDLALLTFPATTANLGVDLASFQGIYFGQPFSEGKLLSEAEENHYLCKIFDSLPTADRILVLLHPQERLEKYHPFPRAYPIFNHHFPNEIWLHQCRPKYVLSAYSTILINSALIFPNIPHLMLYRTVESFNKRSRLKSLDIFFGEIRNIFLINAIEEIPDVLGRVITPAEQNEGLDEADFFSRYFDWEH